MKLAICQLFIARFSVVSHRIVSLRATKAAQFRIRPLSSNARNIKYVCFCYASRRTNDLRLLITDHFNSPSRAIVPVCVSVWLSVCVSVLQLLNKIILDVDIYHADSCWRCLGHVRSSKSQIKVHHQRMKNVAKTNSANKWMNESGRCDLEWGLSGLHVCLWCIVSTVVLHATPPVAASVVTVLFLRYNEVHSSTPCYYLVSHQLTPSLFHFRLKTYPFH